MTQSDKVVAAAAAAKEQLGRVADQMTQLATNQAAQFEQLRKALEDAGIDNPAVTAALDDLGQTTSGLSGVADTLTSINASLVADDAPPAEPAAGA